MRNAYDIEVTLEISGPTLDSCLVCESMSVVEKLLFDSEVGDLQALAEEFRGRIPKIAADAATLRLRRLRGHALQLAQVSHGSVILGGLAGGLALWVLSATLGETLKEAWRGSDLHRQIRDFLLKRRELKIRQLGRKAEDKLPARLRKLRYTPAVTVGIGGDYSGVTSVYIRVEATFVTVKIPTYHEVLDEDTTELLMASEFLSNSDL